MHNLRPHDAEIERLFMAKASLVAENSETLRTARVNPPAPHPLAKRRYDREDLLGIAAEIRRQVQHGGDSLLKGYGFSILGIAYFLETRLGEEPDRARLLAHAMESLWTSQAP